MSGPAAVPTAPGQPPVVVVGGGLSGLIAAVLLEAAGQPVWLVEARSRLGGRLHGEPAGAGQFLLDLGAAWVWPEINPRLAHWLEHLALPLFAQHSAGASLVELADRRVRRQPAGWAQQPVSMRLAGGTASLVAALRARLPRSRISLDTRLVGLQPGAGAGGAPDGLRLTLAHAGQRQQVQAAAVISTLTPRQLATAVTWAPELPAALAARWLAAPTWMAAQAKFVACYAQPFWRAQGLSGHAASQAGPLVEVHDAGDAAGGVAALFGFVGFPHPWRAQVGPAELQRHCLQQLARLFGPEAAQPERAWLQDWATEPFTATPADLAAPPAHPGVLAHALPAPWHGGLHLAGSEFAPGHPGYLEGAVQAAERAVRAWRDSRTTGLAT